MSANESDRFSTSCGLLDAGGRIRMLCKALVYAGPAAWSGTHGHVQHEHSGASWALRGIVWIVRRGGAREKQARSISAGR